MTGDTLNEKAQERFNRLKEKMKLNIVNDYVKNTDKKDIDVDKLNKIFESKPSILMDSEVSDQVKFIDDTFDFINSLNLPLQLSLAIGLIISGNKTNNTTDIGNAIQTLEDYIVGLGKNI